MLLKDVKEGEGKNQRWGELRVHNWTNEQWQDSVQSN